jgi:hypothetical protein
MMKTILLVCAMLTFTLILVVSVIAQPPMPPPIYIGFVYVGSNLAPVGLNVTAAISGTSLAWTTYTVNGIIGNYKIVIPADDTESTSQRDGAVPGDTIMFYVNGTKTGQTATWADTSDTIRLDLSVPEVPGLNSNASLTILADCPSAYAGYKVDINGRLSCANGTGVSGASLSLTYMLMNGITWNSIGSVNTAIDGTYHYEWSPPAIVDYLIKVSWEGNNTLNLGPAEAHMSLASLSLEDKYVFSVVSNSTIFELAFNTSSNVLSFGVDGPPDTTGYSNVTIAKDLIADVSGLKLYLDANQTNYAATSADTSWTLYFTYQQSTHMVTVDIGQSSVPFIETSLGMATLTAAAIVIAISAVVALRIRKGSEKLTATKKGSKPQKT